MEVYAERSPIRVILNQTGRSLRDAAEEAGVHHQVVYLTDCGCYTSIPPKLLSWLSRASEINANEIELAYRAHQRAKRALHPLDHIGTTHLVSSNHPVEHLRDVLQLSKSGFCKRYCIPPAILHSMESSGTPNSHLSMVVVRALRDAQMREVVIDYLREQYDTWRKQVA